MNLDELPDAVLVLDAGRVITEANHVASWLTGYRPADLTGRPVTDLAPRARDGQALLDDWHPSTRLRAVRRVPERQVTIRRATGEDLTTYVVARYRRDSGGELAGAVISLRAANARRDQAATGIEIVSTVSHELRSPLTSVKGYTSLLLTRWDRLTEEQKKMMLEQVNHDADRVTRLITELLDISRLESGRLVLHRQMINLPELAASVVDKVTMEYDQLDCEMVFPEDYPRVYADPDKVVQVLTNLVENACKYASPVGLCMEGTVHDGHVSLELHDRGEGFPAKDLAQVFTKFFRRASTKPTGSGLGLWISRGLVEAHGGRLEADSVPGEGSTFRFTLPLHTFEELHG